MRRCIEIHLESDARQRNKPEYSEHQIQLSRGPLTPQELETAEKYWVKQSQKTLHDRLKKGELQQLSPFTGENGITRVGGWADEASVSYETKHPALLPGDHRISLLITPHFHHIRHAGVATSVAKIRTRFWIIRAHYLAKSVNFRYVLCRERLMQKLKYNSCPHFTTPSVISLDRTKWG